MTRAGDKNDLDLLVCFLDEFCGRGVHGGAGLDIPGEDESRANDFWE